MKIHIKLLIVVSILLFAAGISFSLTVDRVLATVNNEAVTLSDYRRFISRVDPAADREAVQEILLKRLIEEKILLLEAVKAGFSAAEDEISQSLEDFRKLNGFTPEEFEKRLSAEGITMDEYRALLRENLITLKLVERDVNSRVIVSDKDIARYYETNMQLFREGQEKLLVKAIFLKLGNNPTLTEITDLKIRSLKIHADIRRGESFDKLVSIHTDEPLRSRDGVLGEFERRSLIPVLDEKMFSLRDEEVSDPVWTKDGVYILKVIKRTAASYTPMERVRDQINAVVYEQKREEKFNDWMRKLWENASVKIVQ